MGPLLYTTIQHISSNFPVCFLLRPPGSQPAGPGFRLCRTAQPYKSWRMKVMVKFRIDTIHLHYAYIRAARPVPDGEMFTLSMSRSFMHQRSSFLFLIRYACQFISFFQYIIISQASQTVTLGLVFKVRCNFS